MIVRKRDGRLELFDNDKILESIKKAALAVECKDSDIQKRAQEIQSLKRQLMSHGFDEDEAEEQAEQQFDGYIEDGEYTEYDEDEAVEVLDIILNGIDSLELDDDDIIDTERIQDFVEKALMTTGHNKTAKEYIIKRANRERIREMNTSLMKSFEELTFGKSEDVETKRENANIDGDSSMGTMLKYGSEGAKKFNLLYVVPPEESEAHSNGDIHIHDLDFLSLTETCITRDMKLVIKPKGIKSAAIEISAHDLDAYLCDVDVDTWVHPKSMFIWSNNQFRKVKGIVRHRVGDRKVYRIHSTAATIEVTGEHLVSIWDGPRVTDKRADQLKNGDKLVGVPYIDSDITYATFNRDDYTIDNISQIDYYGYVYDIETTDNHFMTNGVLVHNCCQIDLEKLFKGGFNTGHGFLREPGEIRSYGALACIAIQSNQNDQHTCVLT